MTTATPTINVHRNSVPGAPRWQVSTLRPVGTGGRVQHLIWVGPLFVRIAR